VALMLSDEPGDQCRGRSVKVSPGRGDSCCGCSVSLGRFFPGPLPEPGVHLSMHRALRRTRLGRGGVLIGGSPGSGDDRAAVAVAAGADLLQIDQLPLIAGWPQPPPQ
jgi:hypothetical protein